MCWWVNNVSVDGCSLLLYFNNSKGIFFDVIILFVRWLNVVMFSVFVLVCCLNNVYCIRMDLIWVDWWINDVRVFDIFSVLLFIIVIEIFVCSIGKLVSIWFMLLVCLVNDWL